MPLFRDRKGWLSPETAVCMAKSSSMEVVEVAGSDAEVYALRVYRDWGDEALDLPGDDLGDTMLGFRDLGEEGRR